MNNFKSLMAYLFTGMLFGLGLCVSDMINPVRVLGFLDVTGRWDATLLMVMIGALCISLPAYQFILKRQPVFSNAFSLPTSKQVDNKLIVGAILFGLGWGLVGFCPGPAIAALATQSMDVFIFVLAMFSGFQISAIMSNRK